MDDNLNTPLALSVLFTVITETNSLINDSLLYNIDEIKTFFTKACNALGIDTKIEMEEIPIEILQLAKERKNARENKNYSLSDKLREKLNEKGYEIKDIDDHFELTKI